jgi:hypothetical protein
MQCHRHLLDIFVWSCYIECNENPTNCLAAESRSRTDRRDQVRLLLLDNGRLIRVLFSRTVSGGCYVRCGHRRVGRNVTEVGIKDEVRCGNGDSDSDSDRNVSNLPNYDVAVYPLYRV